MPDGSTAVSVQNLVKVFRTPSGGELRAVNGISFDVQAGEIFGLLGPNGAGKTTTMEIVEGIQKPTAGSASILGIDVTHDFDRIKPRIGVQLQESEYLEYLSLRELLVLFASFYGKRADPEETLESFGLEEKAKEAISKLSGGQKRRFSLALSLVNDPDVVFLDEPTSGLDPQARRGLWDQVLKIREKGKTVVMTTHHMDEAKVLCDRVGIIDHGAIKALGTPLQLIRSLDSAYHIRFITGDVFPELRFAGITGAVGLTKTETKDGLLYDLEIHDPAESLGEFHAVLTELLLRTDDIRVEPSTLEDVFLSLTGRELRD